MSYRVHIVIRNLETGKPVSRAVHEREAQLLRDRSDIGVHVGTRYGQVGLWLERERKDRFVNTAIAVKQRLSERWLGTSFYTTNATSQAALEYEDRIGYGIWPERG